LKVLVALVALVKSEQDCLENLFETVTQERTSVLSDTTGRKKVSEV